MLARHVHFTDTGLISGELDPINMLLTLRWQCGSYKGRAREDSHEPRQPRAAVTEPSNQFNQ